MRFFLPSYVVFFETSVLKSVFLHYLHNNNTALIPKFQNIAMLHQTYTWQTFVANLFYDKFLHSFQHFMNDFFWKTQNESMFLHNRIFINGFYNVSFYKVRTKLHNMGKRILMSWFKISNSNQKTHEAQKDAQLVFQKKSRKCRTT